MNKKVMAIAVAGALAVPAASALAQTSTVQIGGSFNLLYYQHNPNNPSTGKKGCGGKLENGGFTPGAKARFSCPSG